ncbi:hypothetical protein AGR7B_Lc40302 [Agrobacterium deltaense RV3]|nr:hypothetical protein AGR7B_Lc40302 [Agrobacterium deltaense RV3]
MRQEGDSGLCQTQILLTPDALSVI